MTTASLQRIRQSYVLLGPQVARTTEMFYERVFEVLPEARRLFQVEMDIQRQHFAAAIALVIRNLSMLDALQEPLRELGADHARVGVCPGHYPPVRDAMLFALGKTLGDSWTDELSADWRALLDIVASQMLAGSHA